MAQDHKLLDDELWRRMLSLHQVSADKTVGGGMNYYNVRFLALALCGEAGELANIIKKQWRGLGADGNTSALWREAEDELADIIIYALLAFSALGGDPQFTLRSVMMRKLDKFEQKLRDSGKLAAAE